MKKFYLVFVLFQIGNLFSQSDTFTISKSVLFDDEVKNSVIVLGEKTTEDGIILVRSYKSNFISATNGYNIEKYDANLKLIKEFDYKIKSVLSQKHNVTLGVFYANNKVIIVELFYDLKTKGYVCQANSIDDDFTISTKELFRISKEQMKIYGNFNLQQKWVDANASSMRDLTSGEFNTAFEDNYKFSILGKARIDKENGSDIVLVLSENKLSYSIVLDYKNDDQEGFLLFQFNSNGEQTFFKEVEIDGKEKDVILQNVQVSDDGKIVYVIAKKYEKKSSGLNYSFELTKITAQDTKTKIIEIDDKFINSLKINFKKGRIYCVGFYSNSSYERTAGVCFFRYNDETLAIEKMKFNPFTEQFIEDKYGKQKDQEIKNLKIKTILFENETIILNAEEVFVNLNNSGIVGSMNIGVSSSGVYGNGTPTYRYDDIVCVKLNTDGELIWARNINKKQSYTYTDETYISYFSTIYDGVSYIFINASENIKVLKGDRLEFKDVNPNNANLYMLTVDANGDFNYRLLLHDEQNKVPFIVSKGIVINKSCYFLGRKGKNKQLLKVTL